MEAAEEAYDDYDYEGEAEHDFSENIDELDLCWGSCEPQSNCDEKDNNETTDANSRSLAEGNRDADEKIDDIDDDISKDEEHEIVINLPQSFDEFESLLFSFPKLLSEHKNEVISGLRSLLIKEVTTVKQFDQNACASILLDLIELLTNQSFVHQVHFLCDVLSIESPSENCVWVKFRVSEQNIYIRHFLCEHLVHFSFDNKEQLAFVRKVEEIENKENGNIDHIVSVESDVYIKELISTDSKVKCAPLNKFRKYILQMMQLFDDDAGIVKEQLVTPRFDSTASGLSLVIKQEIFDSAELEGIQKAVDTICSPTSSAFCLIDYRGSDKNEDRISRIVDEICVQFIILDNEILTSNPNLNGSDDEGIMKHRLIVATVEALPIIEITGYLRDCGLRIYHITDNVCAIPSEEQVNDRTIELLEESLSDSSNTDPQFVEGVKKCLSYLKCDDSSGEDRMPIEMILEKFKQRAKFELLKSSDLIIGTISELATNEVLDMGVKSGLKFRTAIINAASKVTELELLLLTHFGAQKFVLVDNKLTSGSIMYSLLNYYEKNYAKMEKGSKCSVVSNWQPPKPVISNEERDRERERRNDGRRHDDHFRDRSSRAHNRHRESSSPYYDKRRDNYSFRNRTPYPRGSSRGPRFGPRQHYNQGLLPRPTGYQHTWTPRPQEPRFVGAQWTTPTRPVTNSPHSPQHIRPPFAGPPNSIPSMNHPSIPPFRPSFSDANAPANRPLLSTPPQHHFLPPPPHQTPQNIPFRSPRPDIVMGPPLNTPRTSAALCNGRPQARGFGTPRPNPSGSFRPRRPFSHR